MERAKHANDFTPKNSAPEKNTPQYIDEKGENEKKTKKARSAAIRKFWGAKKRKEK